MDYQSFNTVGASTTTSAVEVNDGSFVAVAVLDGGGSGFNTGTVTIQGSIDGTNWFTLKDAQGNDITFTAAGYAEVCTGLRYIRASTDASISDVDIQIAS